MRLIVAALTLLVVGCAAPGPSHLRMFCTPVTANTGAGLVEGLLCQPVPDEVPLEMRPITDRSRA